MDTNLLDIKFARIGARLKVADRPARRSRTTGVIALDVQADRKGEIFEIVRQPGVDVEIAVLNVQSAGRHLLLLVREVKDKSKFPAEKATTTARGGDEPLRASFIRGRCPNRREQWIETW
jgi:hypothetical protein